MKTIIWRSSGGHNRHNGQGHRALSSNLSLQKTYPVKAGITASPVFTESGNMLVADMADSLTFYSPQGSEMWKIALQGSIYATPAIHESDTLAYVATCAGRLYAIDLTTGDIVWESEIPSESDPRILSDVLYLPNTKSILITSWGYEYSIINAATGKIKSKIAAGSRLYAGASATEDETVYLVRAKWAQNQSEQAIELVRLQVGAGEAEVLHSTPPEKKSVNFMTIAAPPVINDEEKQLYFIVNSDSRSTLFSYSIDDNKISWKSHFPRHLVTTPAIRPDGAIVISDLIGSVRILDPIIGLETSAYKTGAYYLLGSPVCDAEGTAVVGDIEGKIHLISSRGKGRVLHETGRCIQGRPSFSPNGLLAVPSMDGHVYMFA
jgi:outer membrane protein assembly factor BamB